ncbi:hypothetical protein BJV78DRAFT_1231833 [Lactifluus subvellereus]|nr:hypothetical protein BJV78DRAFT_1231833 [Lactifluus subvellereus]
MECLAADERHPQLLVLALISEINTILGATGCRVAFSGEYVCISATTLAASSSTCICLRVGPCHSNDALNTIHP